MHVTKGGETETRKRKPSKASRSQKRGFLAPSGGDSVERVNRKCQQAIFVCCRLYFLLFQWKMSLDSTKLLSERQARPEAAPRLSFLGRGLDAILLCGDLGWPGAEPSRKQVVHFRQGCRAASQAMVPMPRDRPLSFTGPVCCHALAATLRFPYPRGKVVKNAKLPGGGGEEAGGSGAMGRRTWCRNS